MNRKRITWEFLSPKPKFKCMICGDTAKWAVELGYTLHLCGACSSLTEQELLKRIKEG